MYEKNPAGKATVWLAQHRESNSCAGMTVLFPRTICINGRQSSAAIAGDLLIAPRHRIGGAAVLLQRSAVSSVKDGSLDLIAAIPNAGAEAVIRRVGYRKLGAFIGMVKPLRTERYLEKRNFPRAGLKISSLILDSVLRLASLDSWYAGFKKLRGEAVPEFDERFDVLYDNILKKHRVTCDRSSAYLNWRLGLHPKGKFLVMGVFSPDRTKALGYIVSRFVGDILEIIDFVFPEDSKDADNLMASLIRHARRLRVVAVTANFLENASFQGFFRRWGFWEGRNQFRNAYVFCRDELWPTLERPADWLLTHSDEDI